jgi:hypothetical protein
MLWLLFSLLGIACGALLFAFWVALSPPKYREGRSAGYSHVFTALPAADDSDPNHALIWRTQLPVLELLDQLAPQPVPRSELLKFYRESSRHYPELYEGLCFDDWLKFLQEANLISQCEGEPRLTSRGREFLCHLLASRRSL